MTRSTFASFFRAPEMVLTVSFLGVIVAYLSAASVFA
jgi:hypothetical protein